MRLFVFAIGAALGFAGAACGGSDSPTIAGNDASTSGADGATNGGRDGGADATGSGDPCNGGSIIGCSSDGHVQCCPPGAPCRAPSPYCLRADGTCTNGPCDAGAPFACGDKSCTASQYCSDTNEPIHGGDGGAVQVYECKDAPAGCAGTPTCACVACGECSEDGGHVTCVILAP
jgi:hypothetical protein